MPHSPTSSTPLIIYIIYIMQNKCRLLLTIRDEFGIVKEYIQSESRVFYRMLVVVVVGTYFEYMAVKSLIVPSYRYTLFQRVCNACNYNFPKITYQSF